MIENRTLLFSKPHRSILFLLKILCVNEKNVSNLELTFKISGKIHT